MRRFILGAMVASAIAAAGAMQPVRAATDIYLNFGPPEVRYEAVPTPRAGFVWAPGYWEYRGSHHVWVRGHWVRERAGYVYNSPRWVDEGGRWRFERERWERGDRVAHRGPDRDHDGVPDRFDAHPDNPYRN